MHCSVLPVQLDPWQVVQLYRLFVLSSAEIRSPLSDQRPPPYVGVGHCASSVGDDGEVFGLILLLLSFCNGLISLMVTISAALTDVSHRMPYLLRSAKV